MSKIFRAKLFGVDLISTDLTKIKSNLILLLGILPFLLFIGFYTFYFNANPNINFNTDSFPLIKFGIYADLTILVMIAPLIGMSDLFLYYLTFPGIAQTIFKHKAKSFMFSMINHENIYDREIQDKTSNFYQKIFWVNALLLFILTEINSPILITSLCIGTGVILILSAILNEMGYSKKFKGLRENIQYNRFLTKTHIVCLFLSMQLLMEIQLYFIELIGKCCGGVDYFQLKPLLMISFFIAMFAFTTVPLTFFRSEYSRLRRIRDAIFCILFILLFMKAYPYLISHLLNYSGLGNYPGIQDVLNSHKLILKKYA